MFVKKRLRAEGFLVLATLFWGATFPLTKAGLDACSPFLLLGLRFLLALVFYVGMLWFTGRISLLSGLIPGKWKGRTLLRGVLLGVAMFIGYAMQNLGLKYTSSIHSGFIIYSFALYVPFLQLLFTRKQLFGSDVIGLIVVIAGIFLMASGNGTGKINRGDVYALIGAFGYSFFVIFLDRFNTEEVPEVMVAMEFIVTAILSFFFAFFFEDVYFQWSPLLGLNLFYLAFFASVLSLHLMNRYQKEITPVHAVIIYALEPVFALVIAVLLFSEGIGPRELLACGLVLAGVFASELLPKSPGKDSK